MKYKTYDDILKVKLISHTTSDEECNEFGIFEHPYGETLEELITFCARVSNPSNQSNMETSDRLIQYMIKNKHWSPFEMVNVCLEITSTRDIVRQLLRHRSFSFQEFSQRYADPTKELEFCVRETRMQDNKNRQNSIETDPDSTVAAMWELSQINIINSAINNYKWAIENGIAKEVARAILPEGNTVSRVYVNGNIRSWIHYIEVRRKNGTQKEHMMIARECARVISEIFPPIIKLQEKD